MAKDKSTSLLMAQRLKELRTAKGLSHESLRKALMDKYEIDISTDSLKNYEVSKADHAKLYKNEGMRVEYLRCLADFFGVSADYILGITNTKATNEDVQAVCSVTGLNEDYIYNLMGLIHPDEAPLLREMVNEFLSYAVDDRAIATYTAFRKYIDMDNQRWDELNNLSQDEYDQRAEKMRQFVTAASEHGYLIMPYAQAAERQWKKLHEEYGQFLLSRYRSFDKQGNPRKRKDEGNGND